MQVGSFTQLAGTGECNASNIKSKVTSSTYEQVSTAPVDEMRCTFTVMEAETRWTSAAGAAVFCYFADLWLPIHYFTCVELFSMSCG